MPLRDGSERYASHQQHGRLKGFLGGPKIYRRNERRNAGKYMFVKLYNTRKMKKSDPIVVPEIFSKRVRSLPQFCLLFDGMLFHSQSGRTVDLQRPRHVSLERRTF